MSKKKRRKRRNKGKLSVDSSGKTIIKLRGVTKPPMVIRDKTKYNRKKKHKNNEE